MASHFTHLHLHSEYSLLDGAISLERLVDFGKQHDFKYLAITDHGNVFGAVKFFDLCKKAGINPIIGMEAYFTEDVSIKKADNKYYHLILLVQNEIGYKNLCKLIAYSFKEGFYFKPRIDYKVLETHSEGLIALSACLGGHIPTLLMNNQLDAAYERIEWFKKRFGPSRFFLELQPEDQIEQKKLNQLLLQASTATEIACVATGDCHYLLPEDHEAHEVMLSVQTHHTIDDPDRFTFGDSRCYVRTAQQMLEAFPNNHDIIWRTGEIAEQCNFAFETGKLFFPQYNIPTAQTPEEYFASLSRQGLQHLIDQQYIPIEHAEQYWARLELEIQLITKMGFVGYLLIVSDFIRWARRQGIPVGPGRGSAAGSLVAWALEITNIDPIKYNLLFERFLNPERISMPDIDVDFCIEGRDRVINYVRDLYGHDHVCHIITFGTMMAKGVIKDVARVLNIAFDDAQMISNLIPEQLKITLHEAVEQEPRLKELINTNPKIAKLFELAYKLEGLTRHASKHAAGIVISPQPVHEILPLYIPPKGTELVAQYAMTELESIGFLKIDFLGLKNLTLIDRVVHLIKKEHNPDFDITRIPLDDPATFILLSQGKTSGVFQLESDGLKEVLRKLQPEKFEDIIAVNALYRPGPLGSGMVDDFIERKHGRQKITYLFDELAPILQETYGVIVYQEQVMKIASAIGGYSLGEADILRRAMGKKKAEVMEQQRAIFMEKSIARNFDAAKAGELFDLMAYFAGYGFNKSHSAAYALIAYQTAYLKANYTALFMACLISLDADNPEKMSFYLQEARDLGIPIVAPDINTSDIEFSVINGNILFGLRGIRNIGAAALENIISARKEKPFLDLMDFCKRVDLRTANKRVIESLICAGAFDSLPGTRAQKFDELSKILELAHAYKRDSATGQMGLFGGGFATQANASSPTAYTFQSTATWNDKEKLEHEQEALGFYISSHPLAIYKHYTSWFSNTDKKIFYIGLLKSKREIVTKKGDRMAFLQLESLTNHAEIIVFPKTFITCAQYLDNHSIFIVKGELDGEQAQSLKIKADSVIPVDLLFSHAPEPRQLICKLPDLISETALKRIKDLMVPGTWQLKLQFTDNDTHLELFVHDTIALDTSLAQALTDIGLQISIQW